MFIPQPIGWDVFKKASCILTRALSGFSTYTCVWNHGEYRYFFLETTALCSIPVASTFTTHIGFVHLSHIIKSCIILYVMTDTVQHKPCRFWITCISHANWLLLIPFLYERNRKIAYNHFFNESSESSNIVPLRTVKRFRQSLHLYKPLNFLFWVSL